MSREPGRARRSSSWRVFAATLVAVFLGEFVTKWATEDYLPISAEWASLADSILLIVLFAPILYFVFFRPMTAEVSRRLRAEAELRNARDELEQAVVARTAELKAANERLRFEAEEAEKSRKTLQFQAGVLDAVGQAVAVTDPGGLLLYSNRFAQDLCGWERTEAAGKRLAELASFTQANGEELDTIAACRNPGTWAGEVEVAGRDGRRFPALLVCAAIRDPEGKVTGCAHVFMDATARREAEEALRYSEQKYSTLVESSPIGIFMVRDGRIVFANRKFAQMLGYPESELLGMNPTLLVDSEDRECVREIGKKRLAGESVPEEYECRLRTRAGELRWVTQRNVLVPFRGDAPVLCNVVDVTDRRKAEQELRSSTEALRGLSAQLLTAQEEERKRVARELHDSIGQSLSAIKFVVESVLDGSSPNERRRNMVVLRSVVPTIQAATEEVRRISMGLRPSTLDDLGLVATIGWFSREFGSTYPKIRVEKTLEVSEEEIPDELKIAIFRIVQEALNNVAKHSGADRVRIELSRTPTGLRLSVEDNGKGIGDPLSCDTERRKGTGLGYMKERAELSGGSLSIGCAPGSGTEVTAVWAVGAPVATA